MYAQYRYGAVRSCAEVLDQVHVEALVYVLCPHLVTRSYVAVLDQVRAEALVVDQNVEEPPSPAWVVGKAVVPH